MHVLEPRGLLYCPGRIKAVLILIIFHSVLFDEYTATPLSTSIC